MNGALCGAVRRAAAGLVAAAVAAPQLHGAVDVT